MVAGLSEDLYKDPFRPTFQNKSKTPKFEALVSVFQHVFQSWTVPVILDFPITHLLKNVWMESSQAVAAIRGEAQAVRSTQWVESQEPTRGYNALRLELPIYKTA